MARLRNTERRSAGSVGSGSAEAERREGSGRAGTHDVDDAVLLGEAPDVVLDGAGQAEGVPARASSGAGSAARAASGVGGAELFWPPPFGLGQRRGWRAGRRGGAYLGSRAATILESDIAARGGGAPERRYGTV